MIGVCGSHACSSAAGTMFFQADVALDTAVPCPHWQQCKCLTLCQLQSGSRQTQSPDSKTYKYVIMTYLTFYATMK